MKRQEEMAHSTTRGEKGRVLMLQYAATRLGFYAALAGSREFMALMVGKRGKHYDTILDVVLMHDQIVSSGSVEVSGSGVNQTGTEIREKYPDDFEILGYSHGHGKHMGVFMSPTDDNQMKEFLEQLVPVKPVLSNSTYSYEVSVNTDGVSESALSLRLRDGSILKLQNVDERVLPSRIQIEEVKIKSYKGSFYSLVTNYDHDYYCVKWDAVICPLCEKETYEEKEMDVKILPSPNSKYQIDPRRMKKEFDEKVTKMGVVQSVYSYPSYSQDYGYGHERDEGGERAYGSDNGSTSHEIVIASQREGDLRQDNYHGSVSSYMQRQSSRKGKRRKKRSKKS